MLKKSRRQQNHLIWNFDRKSRCLCLLDFTFEDIIWGREKSLWIKAHVIGVDILNITSTIVDETTGKMLKQGIHVNSEIHAIIGDRMLNNLFTVVIHLYFVS